ncbi:MAG: biotin--[acetyl-CoA-carboxylase] ligase [Magnetococcales bacterium]|nr:biotin--[acetyl-CoA-carboxylase] ligase [Magnetococcales bacterium]
MSRSPSPTDRQLLTLLQQEANGSALSGEVLGMRLGVSRAAISKGIERLREAGFRIDSAPRRGYTWLGGEEPLWPEALREGLRECRLFRPERIRVHEVLDSTNTEAERLAEAGHPEGTVVWTERQTSGRGRLGRSWVSPPWRNLCFSIVLRPAVDPRSVAQLTLLSGVALAEVVLASGLRDLALKWPNDVMTGGAKLGGILTEMRGEVDRVRYCIVGIGFNLLGDRLAFPPELRPRLAVLEEVLHQQGVSLPGPLHRGSFLAAFLRTFEAWYFTYLQEGFAPLRARWCALSNTFGREVRVVGADGKVETGRVRTLDEEGCLVLETASGGRIRVLAGEVEFTSPVYG